MTLNQLTEDFIGYFGKSSQPVLAFFAPGRVNLIGDHTDYNGGQVLPCAIDVGTTLLIRRTSTADFRFRSTSYPGEQCVNIEQAGKLQEGAGSWINYPLGVIDQFAILGVDTSGIECLYSGNMPEASGLSSSASIEVVTAYALNTLFDCKMDKLALVLLSQRAENEFVGVPCGVMDQYAIAMGVEGKAMQLDCNSLQCQHVATNLGDYRLVLANSHVPRGLVDSAYEQRVDETQQALKILQQKLTVDYLAQVTPAELQLQADLFENQPTVYKRAKHVVTEQKRVVNAVLSLKNGDLDWFGKLMYQSHVSLRDDYAVSSNELDTLVDVAMQLQGVMGSRLTGAGFGGCTVSIVHMDQLAQFKNVVGSHYTEKTGRTAEFYIVSPSEGVKEITT